jgi:hypothetical protein
MCFESRIHTNCKSVQGTVIVNTHIRENDIHDNINAQIFIAISVNILSPYSNKPNLFGLL